MSAVTPQIITALRTAFKAEFKNGLGRAESEFLKVATKSTSTSASNTYGWLGQIPQMREWVGDRVINDIASSAYQIFNKDFETTVGVDRNDIEDDNVGIYAPMMRELGRSAGAQPDELTFKLMLDGFSDTCFDGQPFFDADHPVGPDAANMSTVSNVQAGTGPAWFLLDTSREIKPFIFQERKKPEFISMDGNNDEETFMRKIRRYGVDSRCNVGYAFWQMAFASKQELTAANFNAAYTAMCEFKSDQGNSLGIRPNLLVVSDRLRTQAHTIVADKLADGSSNVNANVVEVLRTPWLNQ